MSRQPGLRGEDDSGGLRGKLNLQCTEARFLPGLFSFLRQAIRRGLVSRVYAENANRLKAGHRARICVRVHVVI